MKTKALKPNNTDLVVGSVTMICYFDLWRKSILRATALQICLYHVNSKFRKICLPAVPELITLFPFSVKKLNLFINILLHRLGFYTAFYGLDCRHFRLTSLVAWVVLWDEVFAFQTDAYTSDITHATDEVSRISRRNI